MTGKVFFKSSKSKITIFKIGTQRSKNVAKAVGNNSKIHQKNANQTKIIEMLYFHK